MSSSSDTDLHFESDSDNKNISIMDDFKEKNNFIIKKNNNNLSNNDGLNIKPMLKNDNSQQSIRRPVLRNKNIPMEDIDLLVNSKKINTSNDNREDMSDFSDTSDKDINNIDANISNTNQYYSDSDDDDDVMMENNKSHNEEIKFDDNDDNYRSNETKDELDDEDEEEEEEEELSYEQIQKMKADIIYKLNRLDKLGYTPSRRYSMASNLEDLKFEYNTLKRQRSIEKSVKFSRKLLMAFVSGTEFLNHKFDYFNLKLDRWSEHTMENMGDYDEVFEELHDKHQDTFEMAPELRLLLMVGGSGFMYHLQQSLFQSATPEISDILRQNPDIMKSVTQAAAGNMASNIAREENDPAAEPILNMMMGNKGRRTMDEPSGVDDILEELGKNTKKSGHSFDDEISTKNIEFSSKKKKKHKRGIQLDI